MLDQSNSPVTLAQTVGIMMFQMEERRPHIEAALAYTRDTHTFDDLVTMVLSGRLAWWALPTGFMLTETIEYPRTKHYHVFLAGGNLEEIYEAHPRLIEAAKLAGCSKLSLGGRRGWVKALKHLGWREAHVCATLDISSEAPNEQGRHEDDNVGS